MFCFDIYLYFRKEFINFLMLCNLGRECNKYFDGFSGYIVVLNFGYLLNGLMFDYG